MGHFRTLTNAVTWLVVRSLLAVDEESMNEQISENETTLDTAQGGDCCSNDLLAELNLSASELLFSAFLYHLNCNPISTKAFVENLTNGWDWIEKPQQLRIKEVLGSAIASDHLDDDQYVMWECCYANLS